MDLDYTREKLGVAVELLASSSKPLNERLACACISGLMLLEPADFPEELRDKATTVLQLLGERMRNGRLSPRLSPQRAKRIAGLIVKPHEQAIEMGAMKRTMDDVLRRAQRASVQRKRRRERQRHANALRSLHH